MTEPTTAVLLPRLPPAVCGVGDYTWQLWKHFADPPPPWHFLVLEGANETMRLPDAPPLTPMNASPSALKSALKQFDRLIVQYTPYGFDRAGAPRWLVEGVQRWKKDDRRLVVMFHEAYAVSPPWKPSFWKAPAQKRVIRQLGELANVSLTSTPWFRDKLEEVEVNARLCPVPSNIPQAARAKREGESLRIAVFGQAQSRRKALRHHHGLLLALLEARRIEQLVIIGAPADSAEATFVPADLVEQTGVLEPQVVAEALAGCDLLLCPHPPEEIRKSGSTAAALSNGCAVLVRGKRLEDNAPALFYEEPDVAVNALTRETIDKLSAAGREWYEQNASWDVCVQVWRESM